jgi:tRNA 2-thiocytidine biosynthesis protein TtcA
LSKHANAWSANWFDSPKSGAVDDERSLGQERDTVQPVLQSPSETSRLESRLLKKVARASSDFNLIEPGDRILVAASGGKDSHALLHLLALIARRAPFPYSLIAVNIDQGQPGFPKEVLPNYFAARGYDYRIVTEDTYSVVKEKIPSGKTACSLCSRLRRGILYTQAAQLGATKIALGHHRDDFIETLLLNILYSGQIKAMPARLVSDDQQHVVIRPLVYCTEAELVQYAREREFPIIPCSLCGSQPNLQRRRVKELIAQLSGENPNVPNNLMAALQNVRPSQLLDRVLLDGLSGERAEDAEVITGRPSGGGG